MKYAVPDGSLRTGACEGMMNSIITPRAPCEQCPSPWHTRNGPPRRVSHSFGNNRTLRRVVAACGEAAQASRCCDALVAVGTSGAPPLTGRLRRGVAGTSCDEGVAATSRHSLGNISSFVEDDMSHSSARWRDLFGKKRFAGQEAYFLAAQASSAFLSCASSQPNAFRMPRAMILSPS